MLQKAKRTTLKKEYGFEAGNCADAEVADLINQRLLSISDKSKEKCVVEKIRFEWNKEINERKWLEDEMFENFKE